jgi:hypothetical protein
VPGVALALGVVGGPGRAGTGVLVGSTGTIVAVPRVATIGTVAVVVRVVTMVLVERVALAVPRVALAAERVAVAFGLTVLAAPATLKGVGDGAPSPNGAPQAESRATRTSRPASARIVVSVIKA